jgi:hypothetical protein
MQAFLELPNPDKLKETQVSEENNINKECLNFKLLKFQLMVHYQI